MQKPATTSDEAQTLDGEARSDAAANKASNESPAPAWLPLLVGLTSGILLWLAFPPVGWWWIAWVAPAGWLWLVRLRQLPGRRPYLQLYFAGLVHWLLVIHWVRLPHWSAYFGWLALSAYLAIYLPLFVGLTRTAVHRWRIPLLLAAPVMWTGLELIKSHLFSGFSMGLLGHTQAFQPWLIQVADLAGAYGIAFAIMWVAAGAAQLLPIGAKHAGGGPRRSIKTRVIPALSIVIMFVLVVAYGKNQMTRSWTDDQAKPARLALIQGSMDTTFEEDNRLATLEHYIDLTREALQTAPNIDLIIWPESMYPRGWVEIVESFTPSENEEVAAEQLQAVANENRRAAGQLAKNVGRPMLVGLPGYRYNGSRVERFNSAAWLEADRPEIRYHKMHPVMFGEFVPGGEWFPWLYELTPMQNGLTSGDTAVAFRLGQLTLCPNICYENTVPHLIRNQVTSLTEQGATPDALVTITNDGWFWGSSQLDFHLACGIFRSVELRRPQFIAANTGFSAWIDAHGRVLRQGPRREPDVLLADARPWTGPRSVYERWGDLCAWLCAAVCVLTAVVTRIDVRR